MEDSIGRPGKTSGSNRAGKQPAHPRMKKTVLKLICIVFLALLVRFLVIAPYRVPTSSMSPTLLPGDCILAWHLAYSLPGSTGPGRNDIVIFQRPDDPGKVYTKRIVAIEGDTIEIRKKTLFINGQKQNHSFAQFLDPSTLAPADRDNRDNLSLRTIPKGEVFILGDNRDNSLDSRVWGSLDADTVKARVLFVYWSKDSDSGRWRLGRIGRWIR